MTGSTLRPRDNAFKAAVAGSLEREVWPLIAGGKVKPVIHATFPLAQAGEEHALMETSAHIGKIVLEVAQG
jgi:NADPH2:quinone reductase